VICKVKNSWKCKFGKHAAFTIEIYVCQCVNGLERGFSNYATRNRCWCPDHCLLVHGLNKKYKHLKKISKTQATIFANTQFCRQHYVTHPCCYKVFQISDFFILSLKNVCGAFKLLNFI
jgi:hypothetical protein